MKGNSFANGADGGSGATGFRTYGSGWQAPQPVSLYSLVEGERAE